MITKEQKREYDRKYYQANREKRLEYQKLYSQTPMGRALRLLMGYNKEDKKRGRGKGNLTAKWILENIMSKPCAHCGISGWEVIGCNRIDNSKPHSKDNVEPCCKHCNDKLSAEDKKTDFINRQDLAKQVFQYSLDNKLVQIWPSTRECERSGFHHSNVTACCNGNRQTHKGYRWSHQPL